MNRYFLSLWFIGACVAGIGVNMLIWWPTPRKQPAEQVFTPEESPGLRRLEAALARLCDALPDVARRDGLQDVGGQAMNEILFILFLLFPDRNQNRGDMLILPVYGGSSESSCVEEIQEPQAISIYYGPSQEKVRLFKSRAALDHFLRTVEIAGTADLLDIKAGKWTTVKQKPVIIKKEVEEVDHYEIEEVKP